MAASIENGRGMPAAPYRIYGSYALVFITSGRGGYRDANGFAQEIHAGDLILVFPELPHTYGPKAGRTWGEFYIVYDGPVFEAWRSMGLLSTRQPVYSLRPVAHWLSRLRSVVGDEPAETIEARSLQICRLLTLLTEIVTAHAAVKLMPDDRRWLTRACSILGERLEENLVMAEFAARLGMSPSSFRKTFKRELGMSPSRYRAGRRIETACDLLQYTGMTGAQIAERLGFADEYHFSKRFKELRGESPRQFRQRHFR